MGLLSVNASKTYLLVSNLSSFVFCVFMVVFMGAVLASKNNSHSRATFRKLIGVVIACLVADMLTEKGNDEYNYPYKATQKDFDKF